MVSDSTPAALEVQREVWRRLGPAGRARLALEMSEEARRITLAGAVAREPELEPHDLHRMVIATLYGIDQAKLSLPA